MSATRLAQDLPQRTQNSDERIYDERTIQDTPQYEESLRNRKAQEKKRLKQEEKERLAELEREKINQAHVAKIFASLENAGNINKDRSWEAKQYNADRNVIINRNRAKLANINFNYSFVGGVLQRTSADILQGKSAVPLKQVTASVRRQVESSRLNDKVMAGMFIGSLQDYQNKVNTIQNRYQTKKSQESKNRQWHSTNVAQGKASQGVQQNFGAGSKFSTEKAPISKPAKITNRIGSGSTTEPFRATQPNKSAISPYIREYNSKPQNISTISQGGSFIGYSPSGKPIQGAVRPKYTVTTPDGKERTFDSESTANRYMKRIEGSYVKQEVSSGRKETAENFLSTLEADDKVKSFTSRGSGILENFYKGIDKYGRSLDEQTKLHQKVRPNSIEDIVTGFNISIYSQGAGLLNLLTKAGDLGDEHLFGKTIKEKKAVFVPSTVAGEYIGGTAADVFEGKPLKGTGIAHAQAQIDKQTAGATTGQLAGDIIPIIITGGAVALKKVVGVGGEKIVLQTTAKTVGGKTIKDVVTVSKEYKVFGKPIITKTYKTPTVLKETKPLAIKQRLISAVKRETPDIKPKVSLKSSKGTFSLGSTKAKTVLERAPINPQGRGFELQTGGKAQTKFNLKTLKELETQGKITKRDVSMFETVTEGVKLVQKAPVKTFKTQINLNTLTTLQSAATFSAVRILQSPKNWIRGQRRVGKVGGSYSQESQLRPQYRKGDIHDLDVDVRSTKIAKRAAGTVYEKVSPFSTKEANITLSGKKVKVNDDEFAEFLDAKDAVQYQGANVETGLRFGQKFGDDKLSQYFKRPIKDPVTGVKIRSLKDQAIAKGASVLSLQGGMTEKFVGAFPKVSTKIESGKVLFHGTTPTKAKKILSDGFDVSKSRTSDNTIFTSTSSRDSYGHLGSNLKVTMKKDAKTFDVNKQKNPQLDNDELRGIARKDKADIITNMKQSQGTFGEEVEIVNLQAIKSIETVSGKVRGKFETGKSKMSWEEKQNKMIDAGQLSVNPPALRGKDTVDLYKIFKSEAEGLKEAGKVKDSARLDLMADRLKKMNPEFDFGGKSRGVGTTAPTSTSTATSLSVAQAKKGAPFLAAVPRLTTMKQPTSKTQLKPTTSDSLRVKSSRTSLGAVKKPLSLSSARPLSASTARPLSVSTKSVSAKNVSAKSKGTSKSFFSKKPLSKSSSKSTTSKSASIGASKSASVSVSASVSTSVGGGTGSRGYGGLINANTSVRNSRRKVVPLFILDNRNTTKRKKGKEKKPHDFLGNMRLDQIEGMFRRKEVIHGDRGTMKQIRVDKKKGFNQSKIKIF